jgi:hypothetical protein
MNGTEDLVEKTKIKYNEKKLGFLQVFLDNWFLNWKIHYGFGFSSRNLNH